MKTLRLALPLLVFAAAVVLGPATPPSPAKEPPAATSSQPPAVLGISTRIRAGTLAWFDPLTLKPLRGRKVGLGFHTGSYAFSADRATLAIADECDSEGRTASLRLVNARAMRTLGDLILSPVYDCAGALTWLRPSRLLALLLNTSTGASEIAVVDPGARRVLRRVPLPNAPVVANGATSDELVLLLGSDDAFVPARIATVDAEGTLRSTVVDDVLVGTVVDRTRQDYRARTISPGFAVDPVGRRAFLVPASGPVAEVDLRTFGLSYHVLDHPSLLQRFFGWLTPAAEAKAIEGPVREVRWLGNGVLAVSGVDYSIADEGKQTEHMVAKPAGVELVDTGSWQTRMLSSASAEAAVAPGLVIAEGGGFEGEQGTSGPGIMGFGLDGQKRWALHTGENRWLYDHAGSIGYLWLSPGRMEVVDLASGTVLRTLQRDESANPWPWLLSAQRSG